jgi:uncharacterized protein (DUF924 family)
MRETPATIREFWFGADPDDEAVAKDRSALWWMKSPETDREIAQRFEGFLDFAVRHRVIIERFGRFPHRNAILGRPSTEEELEFLEQPDSSF